MHSRLTTIVALVALAAPLAAQNVRRDGKWDVTMEMDMPGMPAGAMKPFTMTQCITPEMLKDPKSAVPGGRGGERGLNNNCKFEDYKVDGNKVTWSMKCEGPRAMTGHGELTYGKDSYVGTVQMDMDAGRSMSMKYSGKRLGDCDEKK